MQLLSYVQNSLSLLLCQGLMPNSPKSWLLGVDAVCICCSTQRISLHQQLCIECIIVSLSSIACNMQSLKYKLNRWYSRMSHSCCQFIFNLWVARSLSIRSFLTICVDCSESQVTKKWKSDCDILHFWVPRLYLAPPASASEGFLWILFVLEAKGCDHESVRALEIHPKALTMGSLDWSV